jgi:Zn-dependent protease
LKSLRSILDYLLGSIPLGRLWGVDVFLHRLFLVFLAFFAVHEWMHSRQLGQTHVQALNSAGNMVALLLSIFTCVLLHEYGHVFMARAFGIGTVDITLLPIGGVAQLERIPVQSRQEILVAIAGPAVNLALALILWAIFGIAERVDLERLASSNGELMHKYLVWKEYSTQLLYANLIMIGFNAIPAFPMDGGRVLRAVLALRMNRLKATQIAASIGKILAVVLAAYGIQTHQYLLMFTATFVWVGATREAEAVAEDAAKSNQFITNSNPENLS